MNGSRFEKLWNLVVPNVIQMSMEEVDAEFMKERNLHLCDITLLKQDIESFYNEIKEQLKLKCTENVERESLDLHKLAAIFCSGLLKYKPVVFDDRLRGKIDEENSTYILNNYLINYKIAFYVAAGIVYYDIIEKVQKDDEVLNYIINEGCLLKYPTNDRHSPFENSVIIELARNDYEDKEFNYFTFAILMFQWQEYSLLKVKYDLIKTN